MRFISEVTNIPWKNYWARAVCVITTNSMPYWRSTPSKVIRQVFLQSSWRPMQICEMKERNVFCPLTMIEIEEKLSLSLALVTFQMLMIWKKHFINSLKLKTAAFSWKLAKFSHFDFSLEQNLFFKLGEMHFKLQIHVDRRRSKSERGFQKQQRCIAGIFCMGFLTGQVSVHNFPTY